MLGNHKKFRLQVTGLGSVTCSLEAIINMIFQLANSLSLNYPEEHRNNGNNQKDMDQTTCIKSHVAYGP